MGDKNAEVDPKLAHSINYNISTSEIKDDIPALCDNVRNGKLLTRSEAGFLLWYHALSTPEKRLEITDSSGCGALLFVLADPKGTPAEQSIALGILRTISEDEELIETVGASKAPGSGLLCVQCVTNCILRGTDTQALSAAAILRNIAMNPVARKSLLREMPNWVALLRSMKLMQTNEMFKAHLLKFISLCASDRPEIREELERIDALHFCTEQLATSPSDDVVVSALSLMNQLAQNPAQTELIVKRRLVPMLMEVFGEPAPKPALLQIPGEASMLDVEQSMMTLSSGPSALTVSPSTMTVNPSPSTMNVSLSPTKSGKKRLHVEPEGPRLGSGFQHSIQAHTEAANILWHIAQVEEGRIAITKNSGSWRLCTALKSALDFKEDDGGKGKKGGGGKKKGKGLVLLPVQEAAVNAITGCMRHISLVDTNKIRIARFEGILKVLASMYEQAAKASIRWNARGILSNVSTMKSNEELMKNEGVPEEFGGLSNLEIDAEMERELQAMPN